MKFELLLSTSIPAGLSLLGALLWTCHVRWAWTLLGGLLVDTFCLYLKEIIRQPRPVSPPPVFVLETEGDFGMPSEHAAFVMYLFLHLGSRLHDSSYSWSVRWAGCLLLLAWGTSLIVTRYVYGAHSLQQLLCGGCIGAVAGCAWSCFESRLSNHLARWQLFIDSSLVCIQSLYGIGNLHMD
eukprot:symbB.v1.2.016149.t1/scaffold1224.1/size148762/2